jgi:hypothetical protein
MNSGWKMARLVAVVTLIVSAVVAGATTTYAGKDRVTTYIKNNDIVAATSFHAERLKILDDFFSWKGNLQTPGLPVLFVNNNPAGQNAFTAPFAGVLTLPAGNFMTANYIVTAGSTLDRANSSLKNAAGNIATKFDPLKLGINKPNADFSVDISNETQSAVTMLSLEVRVDNTQDPYDLSQAFIPDGTIDLSQNSPVVLLPGQDITIGFADPSNPNSVLSVVATDQDSSGDIFSTLVATVIPEPSSLSMLILGGIVLLGHSRCRA